MRIHPSTLCYSSESEYIVNRPSVAKRSGRYTSYGASCSAFSSRAEGVYFMCMLAGDKDLTAIDRMRSTQVTPLSHGCWASTLSPLRRSGSPLKYVLPGLRQYNIHIKVAAPSRGNLKSRQKRNFHFMRGPSYKLVTSRLKFTRCPRAYPL